MGLSGLRVTRSLPASLAGEDRENANTAMIMKNTSTPASQSSDDRQPAETDGLRQIEAGRQ